jgi:hypothetical protein
VDIPSSLPLPARDANVLAVSSGCDPLSTDPLSTDAVGALVSDATNGASAPDLPTRPISDRQLIRKIRSMDDPEVLQRVLAGLLNLQ